MAKFKTTLITALFVNQAMAVGGESFELYQDFIHDIRSEVRSYLRDMPQTRRALAMTCWEENRIFWAEIERNDKRGLKYLKWDGVDDPIESFRLGAALWHLGVYILYYQGTIRKSLGEGIPWYSVPLKGGNLNNILKEGYKTETKSAVDFIGKRFKYPLVESITQHTNMVLGIISDPKWNEHYWIQNKNDQQKLLVLKDEKLNFLGKILSYAGSDPSFLYDSSDKLPQMGDVMGRFKYLSGLQDKLSYLPPQNTSDRADHYSSFVEYNLDRSAVLKQSISCNTKSVSNIVVDEERIDHTGSPHLFYLTEAIDNNFFAGNFVEAERLALELEKMRYYRGDYVANILPVLCYNANANLPFLLEICDELHMDNVQKEIFKEVIKLLSKDKYDDVKAKFTPYNASTIPSTNYIYFGRILNRILFMVYMKIGDRNMAVLYKSRMGF